MSINASQLLTFVIQPTLANLGLDSVAARNLLLATCAQESHMGTFLKQINGPALGIYQIEPATHQDIWNNFLVYRSDLAKAVRTLGNPKDESLIYNLAYSTAICRLIYLRCEEPLPDADDMMGLANYWKKYYNTVQGEGNIEHFVKNYQTYILL